MARVTLAARAVKRDKMRAACTPQTGQAENQADVRLDFTRSIARYRDWQHPNKIGTSGATTRQ